MESQPLLPSVAQPSEDQAKNVALFLKKQWPAVSIEIYSKSIISSLDVPFPKHFIMKSEEGDIIGHVKIEKCFQRRAEGVAALVTSLLVAEEQRGKGLGRHMMAAAQEYVKSQNIPVVALSTKDKISFYQKLGYKKSLPLSKKSKLDSKALALLEAHFAKKANLLHHSSQDVWLSKRVIQEFPFFELDLPSLKNERIIRLEHQLQIGPNCGVVALRMVRRLRNAIPIEIVHQIEDIEECEICGSKSQETKEEITDIGYLRNRGASYDGEVFCINVLQDLGKNVFNLNSKLCNIAYLQNELVQFIDGGKVIVLAFDVEVNGDVGFKGGSAAHWGIIIGYSQEQDTLNCIMVHSKTRTTFKVPLSELTKSNLQLKEYAKDEVGDLYKIPEKLNHLRGYYLVL